MTLKLDEKEFSGLVDTGTDVTIIKREAWPITWFLATTLTHLKGIGQSQNLGKKNTKILALKDKEGNQGTIQPCVITGTPCHRGKIYCLN